MAVPLYRHETSLDYTRIELGLQYTLTPQWDVVARVPWEQKEQRSSLSLVDPVSDVDRAAMQRNVDLHHRTATLRGLSDVMLLGRRRWARFSLAIGGTIPTGSIVEDPYALGDAGLEHQHIQFGTGTIDPLIEASYSTPVTDRLTFGASMNARLPFYENRRGFRAPPDGALSVHVAQHITDRVRVRLEGTTFAQGYGYWNGVRDENTGLVATSISGGVTFHRNAFSVSADLRQPISQQTLDEGDSFTQGPTFIVGLGFALKPF